MEFSERLKATRQKAGLTQREVAARLGITYQSYGQYERGLRKPKHETIEKIADALGCSVYEFIDATPKEVKRNSEKVGKRLEELRIRAGLTLRQAADSVGISEPVLLDYETGEQELTEEAVEQLAQLYHADPLYIILGITQDSFQKQMETKVEAYHAHVETVRDESLSKIKGIFDRLNEEGMKKAVERVEELSEMQRYQRR